VRESSYFLQLYPKRKEERRKTVEFESVMPGGRKKKK